MAQLWFCSSSLSLFCWQNSWNNFGTSFMITVEVCERNSL
jgi:hypothetical protein